MIAYPDTSFLRAMYRFQANSQRAATRLARMAEPLHVSSPLLFEFRQPTRWQVFLNSRDRSKGFDRSVAQTALAKLRVKIASVALLLRRWTGRMSSASGNICPLSIRGRLVPGASTSCTWPQPFIWKHRNS